MTTKDKKDLIEFATRINFQYGNKFKDYNNLKNNAEKHKEIINDPNMKKSIIDNKYILYSKIEPNSHQHVDHFIDPSVNKVIAITLYSVINSKNMMEELIWRLKNDQYRGIITHLYINFYFEKYNAIISDDRLSDSAFKSWLRKVKEVLECGGKAAVVNPNYDMLTPLTLNNYEEIMNKNYQVDDNGNDPIVKFDSPTEDELNQMNRFDRETYKKKKSINFIDYMKSNRNRFMIYK